MCSRFVSFVCPVAVLSAVFWMICSLFMLVSLARGDQIVLQYSIPGLTTALYVKVRVSFCFPQCVVLSAFIMFRFCLICLVYL